MPVSFAAILLAAGGSSRLGQPKQLLQIDGESLVRRTARALFGLNPARVVVVTGGSSERVSNELKGLPVHIQHNPDWPAGMGSSIALGASQIPAEADGVLILLCDQWCIDTADLNQIVSRWTSDISRIYAASWNDENAFCYGPPVMFPRKYIHELEMLKGEHGARSVINRCQHEARFIVLENAAFDVDVPADLKPFTAAKKRQRPPL